MDERTLAGIVEAAVRRLGVAGGQAALFDGTELIEAAEGIANAETGDAVTPGTLFQIGSTTKLYAAALSLILAGEGRIDLDEPVASYLPDLHLANSGATSSITLRQLHSMTSGMDNGPYTSHGHNDDSLARYVASLAEIPPIAEPGVMFGYSNASTCVAGRVTEVITGMPWEEALETLLLRPAGLSSTLSRFEDLVLRKVAAGHRRQNGEWTVLRPWRLPRSMSPAGSTLCATAGDLARFASLLLRGGRGEDGTQILSPAAVETMQRPVLETPTRFMARAWCVGSYLKDWDGHALYGHSGTNLSGSSILLWSPEENLAIAAIANVPPLGYPFAYAVFGDVLKAARGWEPPAPPQPNATVDVDVARYAGRYTAYGVDYEVEDEDGNLTLAIHPDTSMPELQPVRSELRPLGGDRFLPRDVAVSGGRGWDVAFVDPTNSGRATHFVNGVMAARREDRAAAR